MELLKQRIRKDGLVKAGNVLKVDSFLNHQMDVRLFAEIGKEFKRRFAGCGVIGQHCDCLLYTSDAADDN